MYENGIPKMSIEETVGEAEFKFSDFQSKKRALSDSEIVKKFQLCTLKAEHPGFVLCGQIVDLINRLQAENKDLKTENLILSQKRFNIFERVEFTGKLKKQAKSEANKEFADRLKKETYILNHSGIDNLLKELVGEGGQK